MRLDSSDTTPCARCGHQSWDYRVFIINSDNEFVCKDVKACACRKRRDERNRKPIFWKRIFGRKR